jgi:hypothetical protein
LSICVFIFSLESFSSSSINSPSGELDFITRRIEYNDTLADIHCTDLEDNRTLASYALKDGIQQRIMIVIARTKPTLQAAALL